MNIAFLRSNDFPIGGAPQNRALGICGGIIENGGKVEVHLFTPGKRDHELNKKKFQIFRQVPIYNHAWKWTPIKGRSHKIIGAISGILFSFIAILRSNRKEPFDWIFINSNKNIYAFPFFILSRIIGAKFGRELNEFPLYVLNPKKYNGFSVFIKKKTNYKYFDVFLVMTRELIKFYKALGRKKSQFLLLPMTVDLDRFKQRVNMLKGSTCITYVGDLSQRKDGVLDLLQAFGDIHQEYPEIKLQLVGENRNTDYMNLLRKTISDLNLKDKVILKGYIDPQKIPEILISSRLLALARPDSKQAQGGFPTKLGEYLASGVPVVVTRVGEIPDYLEEGVNAYLASPGNITSISLAMKRALDDIEKSEKIGKAGRDTAERHFSHSIQGKRIIDFLEGINSGEIS